MSATLETPVGQLNREGVDPLALACEIERWLDADPDRTALMLSQHSGVHERGIYQLRKHQRPACSLDWADRLCMAMDVDLDQVAPFDPARPGKRRCGKRLDAHLRHITVEDLNLAHDLHWRGVPLRRIARHWQQSGRISYTSQPAAISSMYEAFKARGWERRDRIEMVRRVSTTHGRAGRAQAKAYGPDYAAYRREQRKRAGTLRDVRCAARSVRGEPCERFALSGSDRCVAHDPNRKQQRQRTLDAAHAASRARMLRWDDLHGHVDTAIHRHGRPALCRASGIDTSVLGRMLRYAPDQPIKPETWIKLKRGIHLLDENAATPNAT